MDIQQAFNKFITESQDGTIQKKSKVTIKNYEDTFKLFIKNFPIVKVKQINEGVMRQFFKWGDNEKGWEPVTNIYYRSKLAPFINWCLKRGYLKKDPLENIPMPRIIRKIPEYYRDQEIERMLYVIDRESETEFERARNKAIIAVATMTGIRRGELIGLKIDDLDFNENYLQVRGDIAKDRDPRVIPMTIKLVKHLQNYFKEREKEGVKCYSLWVSARRKDKALTLSGLRYFTKTLTRRSGVKIKLHKFRHTFATKYYQGTRDLAGLQKLMGHSKVETTMIYTQVIPDDTRENIEENPLNCLF